MILISHRGNISGVELEKENTIPFITSAIDKGFNVEIDVWLINGELFLGHDFPKDKIELVFLHTYKNILWIHCKNIDALDFLKDDFNCFFHDIDDVVLTSNNFIWTYPGKKLTNKSIAVLPEGKYSNNELIQCLGICSDHIKNYKNEYYSNKFRESKK